MRGDRPQRLLDKLYSPVKTVDYTPPVIDPIQSTLQTTSTYPSSHLSIPFKPPQSTLQTTSIYPSNHLNLPFKPPQSTLQATSTYPSNHLSLSTVLDHQTLSSALLVTAGGPIVCPVSCLFVKDFCKNALSCFTVSCCLHQEHCQLCNAPSV